MRPGALAATTRIPARRCGTYGPGAGETPGSRCPQRRLPGCDCGRGGIMAKPSYVRCCEELGAGDVALVGGKNASLGEMYRALSGQGVRVPHGFAVTASAYRHVLDEAKAWDALHAALDGLDPADLTALARAGKRAREIVYGAGLPADLAAEIIAGYRRLQLEYGDDVSLAVRSSATAEDLPAASFAGAAETFLNITGDCTLLAGYRRCFASLFTDRSIH